MNILFVHQNFPGQFKYLAPALVQRGDKVIALSMKQHPPTPWYGVQVVSYGTRRESTAGIHPWLVDFETKVIRGEACFHAARKLKNQGFEPDIIIAHHGWGESLFLKEVWPHAKIGIYCEFFYKNSDADVGFDPEFSAKKEGDVCRVRLKNLNNLLHFETADAGISPTRWQASTFPEPFRSKITVVHDGIDTGRLAPNSRAALTVNTATGKSIELKKGTELVTFVNRNLEPYRGFHIFMRALPGLLQQRPSARFIIVGGDGVSYGAKPKNASGWKEIMLQEVRHKISAEDWQRVHFVGYLEYTYFITLLQLSTVHVYLTYPFVLSWSLLEAMSIGCTILASDTPPLHEAIRHDETGRLVDFFDIDALTVEICSLLDDPAARTRLGQKARQFAVETYDLQTICLPRQLQWVDTVCLEKRGTDHVF